MTIGHWRPDGLSANVTGGQLLHLTMWADLASISTIFCSLQEGATGEIALGLISSLIRRTANIFDKDIWWREVHSSRLPSLEPEPFT